MYTFLHEHSNNRTTYNCTKRAEQWLKFIDRHCWSDEPELDHLSCRAYKDMLYKAKEDFGWFQTIKVITRRCDCPRFPRHRTDYVWFTAYEIDDRAYWLLKDPIKVLRGGQ